MTLLRNAWKMSDGIAATALLIVAPACAAILLALPRPVEPNQLPSLRLNAKQVAQTWVGDQASAKDAPRSPPAVQLRALLLEEGRSERALSESPGAFQRRRDQIRQALAAVRRLEGEKAILALRAQAVTELESGLDLALPSDQTEGLLGSFPSFLQRYRAAKDGVLVAPRLVVRTMFKGRWNMLHELPSTYALSPVERLAYYGWLALHADGAPLALRYAALEQYQTAGGRSVAEAKGTLLFLDGQFEKAVHNLQDAFRQHRTLRLRNYVLGAQQAAAVSDL